MYPQSLLFPNEILTGSWISVELLVRGCSCPLKRGYHFVSIGATHFLANHSELEEHGFVFILCTENSVFWVEPTHWVPVASPFTWMSSATWFVCVWKMMEACKSLGYLGNENFLACPWGCQNHAENPAVDTWPFTTCWPTSIERERINPNGTCLPSAMTSCPQYKEVKALGD